MTSRLTVIESALLERYSLDGWHTTANVEEDFTGKRVHVRVDRARGCGRDIEIVSATASGDRDLLFSDVRKFWDALYVQLDAVLDTHQCAIGLMELAARAEIELFTAPWRAP